MIHGMWVGAWYWENYATFFGHRGYRCVAPYLRHHDVPAGSKAPEGLGGTSLLDYLRDLEDDIMELGEKPILFGHSMGGLLVQMLAERGLAKAAVLIAPAPPAGINALKWSVLKCFLGPILKLKFLNRPHKLSFRASAYGVLHLLRAQEQERIYSRCVWESGRAAREIGFWPLDIRQVSRVDESKVTCPMLVIGSSEDRITPPAVTKKVAEKYRHVSTYREFEGHAHWILGEDGWEEVAGYIAGWLTRHAS